jgi:hypothetical protein
MATKQAAAAAARTDNTRKRDYLIEQAARVNARGVTGQARDAGALAFTTPGVDSSLKALRLL